MKTKLIFLVMLIVCFSCGTNNKPVSDAQKEKIKGEIKEVVNTILKGAEEANVDMVIGTCLDSPDFVATFNGNSFIYQQFADIAKSVFSTLINQKGTIVDEKYAIINNSTVLFTANSKWLMNFKDGHSILQDPWAMQYLFKKIDNKWKVISANESGVEKNVPSESLKDLNQVELMKQYFGTWQAGAGKDTVQVWECQYYGKSFLSNVYGVTKGQKNPWYLNNISFNPNEGVFKGYALFPDGNYSTWIGMFTTEKKLVINMVHDFISGTDWGKFEDEFVNPKERIWTQYNKEGVKISETKFIKVK